MTDLVENNVIRIAVSFSHIIGGLLGIYMIFAEFIYLAQLEGFHLIYFFSGIILFSACIVGGYRFWKMKDVSVLMLALVLQIFGFTINGFHYHFTTGAEVLITFLPELDFSISLLSGQFGLAINSKDFFVGINIFAFLNILYLAVFKKNSVQLGASHL